jgi:ribosome recycling factor
MTRKKDTYSRMETITSGNAIIRVHFPDLTEEERSRRMKQIHKAAADLIREVSIKQ